MVSPSLGPRCWDELQTSWVQVGDAAFGVAVLEEPGSWTRGRWSWEGT